MSFVHGTRSCPLPTITENGIEINCDSFSFCTSRVTHCYMIVGLIFPSIIHYTASSTTSHQVLISFC